MVRLSIFLSVSLAALNVLGLFSQSFLNPRSRPRRYEGQILLIYHKNEDDRNDKSFARVHFKGWSSQWDENITEADVSERIHTLHAHTDRVPSLGLIYEPPLLGEDNELRCDPPVSVGTRVDVMDPTGSWTHGCIVKFDAVEFEDDVEHNLRQFLVKVSYTWCVVAFSLSLRS